MSDTTAAPKNEVKSNWPMWMSSQPKVMSNLGATNEKNANMITRGVFRTRVT